MLPRDMWRPTPILTFPPGRGSRSFVRSGSMLHMLHSCECELQISDQRRMSPTGTLEPVCDRHIGAT